MTAIAKHDITLFEGYLKPKREYVKAIIREGILTSDIDWYATPQPTGMSCGDVGYLISPYVDIRPYIYKTLMFLVGVHAQILKIAEPLLDRILNRLVEELTAEVLQCFRQVKRFGMGGMLQVRICDHS
jgi:exocyst complex component 2